MRVTERELIEARAEIDRLDTAMRELFCRRMEAVRRIADYKAAHGLPVRDEAREREVLCRSAAAVEDADLRDAYADFMRGTMAVSRRYQERLLRPHELTVRAASHDYAITVRRGALSEIGSVFSLDRRVLIVTDSGVPAAYAAAVAAAAKQPQIVTVPQGEEAKTPTVLGHVLRILAARGFTRSDAVVAVGGGAVSDVAGFAAAIYRRGIDFYTVPTTLLAQVDASVGGKTAVNLDGAKNAVGAFHAPRGVLIDPDVLKTLPERQFRSGLAEIVKMAATSDEVLFDRLEAATDYRETEEWITAALRIKIRVVEQDEYEEGPRRILNFGHTLGHAIESDCAMAIPHGECVAMGMLPFAAGEARERIRCVLQKFGLPTAYGGDVDRVLQQMKNDKKNDLNGVYLVEVPRIGHGEVRLVSTDEAEQRIREAWV